MIASSIFEVNEQKYDVSVQIRDSQMDKWNEIRTAYKLAKFKTLSATADDIGVHRSTVMRHIDALEDYLGVKLFQRNDKGYIATEAGLEIMRLGEVTDKHFSQLPSTLQRKEQELVGTLTITSLSEMVGVIMPAISEYQARYPKMRVEVIGDLRNFDLEYGEADIAVRAGDKPVTPDNIVWPLAHLQLVLCAHQSYVDRFGLPDGQDFSQCRFVALNDRPEHLHWNEWIHNSASEENLVLVASSQQILVQALLSGVGLGVLPRQSVNERPDLIEIPIDKDWRISVWALVHRDMFSAQKIKAFLDILLESREFPLSLV